MISDEAKQKMLRAVERYPQSRSAILPALHIAQEEEGFISEAGLEAVAEVLHLKLDEVKSVATFYTMFFPRPVGKKVIKVCTSIGCYLNGCDRIMERLEQKLDIRRGETTPDGNFTLLSIECLASCGTAPVLQVNDDFVENLTPEKVDEMIDQLQKELQEKPEKAAASKKKQES